MKEKVIDMKPPLTPERIWHFYKRYYHYLNRRKNCPACGKEIKFSNTGIKAVFLLENHHTFTRTLIFCSENCIPASIITGGNREKTELAGKNVDIIKPVLILPKQSEIKDFLYWVFHTADNIYVTDTLGWKKDSSVEILYKAWKKNNKEK